MNQELSQMLLNVKMMTHTEHSFAFEQICKAIEFMAEDPIAAGGVLPLVSMRMRARKIISDIQSNTSIGIGDIYDLARYVLLLTQEVDVLLTDPRGADPCLTKPT